MVEKLAITLIAAIILFLILYIIGIMHGLVSAILLLCVFVTVCFLAPYAIEDPAKFGLCVILSIATVAVSMLICFILRRIEAARYQEEEENA